MAPNRGAPGQCAKWCQVAPSGPYDALPKGNHPRLGTQRGTRRWSHASQIQRRGRSGPPGERLQRSGVSSASSVLLGAGVMVFSLVAYFVSMVTAFAVVMTVLVDFGDSQLRIGRISQPAVSVLAGSDRDALTNSEKAREAQKA